MTRRILILEWTGNGPAHSGQCSIRRARDGFVVADELEEYGPFQTFDEALDHGNFHYGGTPQPHVRGSAALARSERLLAAAFDLAGEPGGEVRINGVPFRREDARLVLAALPCGASEVQPSRDGLPPDVPANS